MRRKISLFVIILLLVPFIAFGQFAKKDTSKISFDFMDADIKNVLRILAEISGKNIVISDAIKGKVTIKLDNISWDEALDVILKDNDLAKIEEENIIRIVTSKKFFDEKKRERDEASEFLKEKELRSNMGIDFVTETIFINYADAAEVEKMISGETDKDKKQKGLLSPNGTVKLVKWTNALIIKDTKENIEQVKLRIKEHDIVPPQVQIEARIVQANSDFSKQLGIQWGASYRGTLDRKNMELTGGKNPTAASTTTSYTATTGMEAIRDATGAFPYNVNLPAAVGSGSGGILGIFLGSVTDTFQLDLQLSALEGEGKGKIISNPKVVTSDNQPAKIAQGTSVPYQTVSMSGTQTQFIDAVLGLEVTPRVTKDGNVRLKIKATKDRPIYLSGSAIPGIDKKEATTEVIVRDGETAVIGGIYESTDSETEDGLPLLRHIPLFGWLFKKDVTTKSKTELLIFITPRIIKNLYAEEGYK
jgi:type IV pilus assembly protein PilQ